MPIYKRCSICGNRIKEGTQCDKCGGMLKHKRKEYDRYARDRKSKTFYSSSEWEKIRELVLDIDKMDVWFYMTKGRIEMANTVHHIVPLADDWNRRADIDNLMSLSDESHATIEQMYKSLGKTEMIERLTTMLRDFRAQMR